MKNIKLILFILIFTNIAYSHNTLKDFSTDGCSIVPDGPPNDPNKWKNCCVDHDISYWMGGTSTDREISDLIFRYCMEKTGSPEWAIVYYLGVRINAWPGSGQSFQWGYGWIKNRGYKPLSRSQYLEVISRLPEDPYSLPYTNQ